MDKAVNFSGAGDGVMAAIVWSYLKGYDIKKTAFAYGRREGMEVNYFPCLNDSDECIELITSLVRYQ